MFKSLYILLFFALTVAFGAYSQDSTNVPSGQNYFLSFVKKVYLNPTILLKTQDFRSAHNVRVMVLPDMNGQTTNTITGFERAMQKIIRFLIEGDDEGTVRLYFDINDANSPFTVVYSEELYCKFENPAKDSIEARLNAPFSGKTFTINSASLFEKAIGDGLEYIGQCLVATPSECGEQPDFQTTQINTKPLSIALYNTTGSSYDIDRKQYALLESYYPKAKDLNTQMDWYAPVKFMAAGIAEPVAIVVTPNQTGYRKQNLSFRIASSGDVIPVAQSGPQDTVKLTLPSTLPPGQPVEIVASYKSTIDSVNYTVGFFMVYIYQPKTIELNLVSVNGYTINQSEIESQLKKVYDPVGVKFIVSKTTMLRESDWVTAVTIESSAMFSNYPSDLKDYVGGVKDLDDYDSDEYYLVYGLTTNASSSVTGYMPRARNIGFIFNSGVAAAKTSAHEVGHGVFHLRHIFAEEELGASSLGTTTNVMDYAPNPPDPSLIQKELYLHQWLGIDDPAFVSWMSGDDEEGAYSTSNLSELEEFKNSSYYAFVDPNGNVIRLPQTIKSVSFVTDSYVDIASHFGQFIIAPVGSLQGFTDKDDIKFNYSYTNGYKNSEGIGFSEFIAQGDAVERIIFGFPCLSSGLIKFKAFAGSMNSTQLSNFASYNTSSLLNSESAISTTELIDLTNEYNGLIGSLKNLQNKIISSNFSSDYYLTQSLDYVLANQPQCNCDNTAMLQPYIFGINSFIQNNPAAQSACNYNNSKGYRRYLANTLDKDLMSKGIYGGWEEMINNNPSLADGMVVAKTEEYYKKSLYLWPKLYAKLGSVTTLEYNADLELIQFIAEEPGIWCIFKTIPFSTRINIIEQLLEDNTEKNEALTIGLLLEMVNEDKSALIDNFEYNSALFYRLYNYFEENYNRELFVNTILNYNKVAHPIPTIYSSASQFPIGPGPLTYDLLYINKETLYATWNNDGTFTISNTGYQQHGGGLTTFVKLILTEDFDFLGLKEGNELTVPLFYAYHIKQLIQEQKNDAFLRNALRLVSVVAAIPTGGATLVFAVSLNAADLVIEINEGAIHNMTDGDSFLAAWHAFYLVADLSNSLGILRLDVKVAETMNTAGFADNLRKFITGSKIFLNKSGAQVLELQNAFKMAYAQKTFYEGLVFLKNGFVREVRNNFVAAVVYGNVRYSIATMDYLEGIGEFCYHFAPGKTILLSSNGLEEYERIAKVDNTYYYDIEGRLIRGGFEVYKRGTETVVVIQRADPAFNHICTSGAYVSSEAKQGTFLVGNYTFDLEYITNELGYVHRTEAIDFAFPVPPGKKFNILHVDDAIYNHWAANGGFFTKVNGPWIDAAVAQKADIIVVSDLSLLYKENGVLTGFGKEINRLEWKHGYRYNPVTHMMVAPEKAAGLPARTLQSQYIP